MELTTRVQNLDKAIGVSLLLMPFVLPPVMAALLAEDAEYANCTSAEG